MAIRNKSLFGINKDMKKLLLFAVLLSGIEAQTIEVFSPEPESQLASQDVLIAASFFGLESIDPNRIRLYIDGRDVSPLAEVDSDMLSYVPAQMAPGVHHVLISVGRLDGGESYTRDWKFTVSGKEKAPLEFKVAGKVTTTLDYDKIDDEELFVSGFGLNLRGSASEWLQFQAKLKLTSDEDPLLQPRNRFNLGFSFSRYLDLSIGDVNPRFTRLTLDGKRVRGFEANLKLGIINFHYIQGQLNRAVQGDPTVDKAYQLSEAVQESDVNILRLNRLGYTFQQDVTGGRLSFGRGNRFQWGFNVMHVRDKKGTIQSDLNDALIELPWDTLGLSKGTYSYAQLIAMNNQGYLVELADRTHWKGKAPRDNLVIGTDVGFYFDQKRIAVESELAFSMLNRNIWEGAISKDELDTLLDEDDDNKIFGKMSLDMIPFDPIDIKNWFILNENITPMAPIDVSVFDDSSNISFGEAILGMPSLALRTKVNLNYFGHYVTFDYSQIGPEYYFLGNPYLLTNNRELTVSDKIRLLNNRMMLSLIYRHQDDNIGTIVDNVTSQNTLTANITLIPGPTLPTFNLSFKLIGRDNGITLLKPTKVDTATGEVSFSDNREKTQTTNIVASLNYSRDMWGINHRINGTIVNVTKEDLYSDRDFDANFVDPRIATNVYNLSVTSRFSFPLKTTLGLTTNSSEFSIRPLIMADSSRARQEFTNLKAEAEYGFFNRKLIVQGGVNYTTGAGQVEFKRVGIKGGTKVNLFKNFSATILAEVRSKSTSAGNKSSVIGGLNLSYVF